MKFQAEIDLVTVLKETLRNKYNKQYIEIFEEVSLGYGVADIVISNLKKQNTILEPAQIALNYSDINIYNLIRISGETTFDVLLETTKSSKKLITNSLNKLIERKYVKQKSNMFIINKDYELPFRNNFAIEAKLKDWKRALKQAYRYKWFAEYTYVVLDDYCSKSAIKNIDLFVKYNIGLVTITTNGNLKHYYNPKRQQPFDFKMQILFSEKIKTDYALAR